MGIILDFHDCLLRDEDLVTLNEGEWVNDNIIQFAMEYLRRTLLTTVDYVLLVDPAVTQIVKLADARSVATVLDSLNCKHTDWIFYVINDSLSTTSSGGSHWSLLVMSLTREKSYHLDSLPSEGNYGCALKIADAMAEHCDRNGLRTVLQTNVAKQRNSCDCGLYVIVFLEILCKNLFETKGSALMLDSVASESVSSLVLSKRSVLKKLIGKLSNVDS
ncbi:hypothetical protein CRM22_001350 [Opisthorchis felineus]|uniref:Ubiquitin-like protease family profile domain-containing protein n=1 Tax=Opisthorchis felineus TaxID=147828 RepID=A0A4S2MH13_OPIFE|nr:hypothetical protein CRM22_001350 [Opisthorchis felineus]